MTRVHIFLIFGASIEDRHNILNTLRRLTGEKDRLQINNKTPAMSMKTRLEQKPAKQAVAKFYTAARMLHEEAHTLLKPQYERELVTMFYTKDERLLQVATWSRTMGWHLLKLAMKSVAEGGMAEIYDEDEFERKLK